MEEKKINSKKIEQPTYEELKNYCNQLLLQRNQVVERLNQVTDVLTKLPWLFKVLENKDMFESDFVNNCSNEIVSILTPSVKEEDENPKQ